MLQSIHCPFETTPIQFTSSLSKIFTEICGVRHSQYRIDPPRGTALFSHAYCSLLFSILRSMVCNLGLVNHFIITVVCIYPVHIGVFSKFKQDIEDLAVEQNHVGMEHAECIHNVDESVVAMIPDIRVALAQFSPITSPAGSFSHSNIASYLGGRQSASGNRGSSMQESPMVVLNSYSTGALSTSLASSVSSTSTLQREMQGQL